MLFDGPAGPYPDSLAAQFGVDAADRLVGLGHGGHHGVRLRCRNVAVLVHGQPVHEPQVVMERELAEKVAAHLDVGVVRLQKAVAGGRGECVVQVYDGTHGHVHRVQNLHALAGVAHAALAHQRALYKRETLPRDAFEKGGQHSPFRLSLGEQYVVGEQKLVAVAQAEQHLQLARRVLDHLVHGIFHSLAHVGAAFAVLANQQRGTHVFARDHLRGVRRENHLVALVREVLERHAHQLHRLRVQVEFRRIYEQ